MFQKNAAEILNIIPKNTAIIYVSLFETKTEYITITAHTADTIPYITDAAQKGAAVVLYTPSFAKIFTKSIDEVPKKGTRAAARHSMPVSGCVLKYSYILFRIVHFHKTYKCIVVHGALQILDKSVCGFGN